MSRMNDHVIGQRAAQRAADFRREADDHRLVPIARAARRRGRSRRGPVGTRRPRPVAAH